MSKCTSNLLTIRAAIVVVQAIYLYDIASASIAYLKHPEPLQRASNIRASGPYIVGSSIESSRRLGCTMALRFGVETGTPSLNSLFEWHGSRQIAFTPDRRSQFPVVVLLVPGPQSLRDHQTRIRLVLAC